MSQRKTGFIVILRNSLIAFLLAAGLAPAAYAGEALAYLQPQAVTLNAPEAAAPVEVKSASSAGYLSQAELQMTAFPAPPAAGSSEDQADMAAVLQWQKDRTDAQCKAALAQADESYLSFFGRVNPFATPLPAEVTAFFKRVSADAGDADRNIKKIYDRDRPFAASAEVNPCLGRPQGFSYPSGHATVSRLFGLVLSDLLPRQGAIFMREADQAALNRVIGGAHYPSDVEAGKKLADLLYQKLKQKPAFAADESALSKYLR